MPKIKGNVSQTSVDRVSEGSENYLKLLRDGTMGIADLIALWSLEGRVFTASGGAATGGLTFQDSGTLDTMEFDMHVVVPANVVIIPLSFEVTYDAYGTIAVVETCLQYGTGSVVGTATADVPPSSNANSGLSSGCTVNFASATGTALTAVVNEIWHQGTQLGITIGTTTDIRQPTKFTYRAMDSGVLQVIGPSQQLVAFCAAQAGTGFITFKYVELPLASIE